MKLESFKDKKVTRRKMVLISLGAITIVGVSLLFYRTYTQFSSEVDLDNDNVLFGFYNRETKLTEMPQKGNSDNLVFEKAVCDNGASVEWDSENWAPLVKGLNKTKTRCTLYFSEKEFTGVDFLEEKEKEEKLKEEPELMYDDTDDGNLRYVGASPNNYIDIGDRYIGDIYVFHYAVSDSLDGKEYNSIEECESDNQYSEGTCEKIHNNGDTILWRIVGVMKNVINVETGKKEDLIKVIRTDSIGLYTWDTSESGINGGEGVNEWSQADIMKLLNPESVYTKDGEIGNSLYWNNESGQCYSSNINQYEDCDFSGNGISEEARNKLAKVRWNTGTFATFDKNEWTASTTYKVERGNIDGKQYCLSQGGGGRCNDDVERTTTWDGYIGLMYPSDYGYAVGKSVREICLAKSMSSYRTYDENDCSEADWIPHNGWTLNPVSGNYGAADVFDIAGGNLYDDYRAQWSGASIGDTIYPVVFLKSNVIISDALGTPENPFVAS